jgi:hypothetical protein
MLRASVPADLADGRRIAWSRGRGRILSACVLLEPADFPPLTVPEGRWLAAGLLRPGRIIDNRPGNRFRRILMLTTRHADHFRAKGFREAGVLDLPGARDGW